MKDLVSEYKIPNVSVSLDGTREVLEDLMKNRTTFIITQRLSSIKQVDFIIVLEDGRIIEKGVHEELLSLKGVYSRLYETQIAGGMV